MQAFEIFVNPKGEETRFFGSFVFNPENIYEKNLGGLYMAGDINNALPENTRILDSIAQITKRKYYNFSFKSNEKALTESLKKANDFLSDEVKKDNTTWLGNLNFSALSIKNLTLAFSQTGDMKVLLMRGGQISEIGKSVNHEDIDPYPLKVFINIISGKLLEGDKVLVLTKELFDFFTENNILNKIAKAIEIDKRCVRRFVPASLLSQNEKKKKISGLCLLIVVKNPEEFEKTEREVITEAKETFSLANYLSPLANPYGYFKKLKRKILKLFKNKSGENAFNFGKFWLTIKNIFSKTWKSAISFFVSAKQRIARPHKDKTITIKVKGEKEYFGQRLGLLSGILKNRMAWAVAVLLIIAVGGIIFWPKKAPDSKSQVADIATIAVQKTINSTGLNYIDNPEIAQDSIGLADKKTIAGIDSNLIDEYNNNLYFWDSIAKEIKKAGSGGLANEKIWTTKKSENLSSPKSLSVEEYIWALLSDNSIEKYYKGEYKETIKIKGLSYDDGNISKVIAKFGIPYLYLSNPENNRMIVADKSGIIIKQFQSDKFSDIKNFSISEDGKTIWILSGSDVYKIAFNPY